MFNVMHLTSKVKEKEWREGGEKKRKRRKDRERKNEKKRE